MGGDIWAGNGPHNATCVIGGKEGYTQGSDELSGDRKANPSQFKLKAEECALHLFYIRSRLFYIRSTLRLQSKHMRVPMQHANVHVLDTQSSTPRR